MSHHRGTSLAEQLADLDIAFHGDPANLRAGAAAEAWQLVWATGYRPYTHPRTGQLAAMLLPEQILRVRPITATAQSGAATEADQP